jgi:hypothetical protein
MWERIMLWLQRCLVFLQFFVTQSLVYCICFAYVVCPFSFGHCVFCSSIYGFWLLLWYLQTLLMSSECVWSIYFKHHVACWQCVPENVLKAPFMSPFNLLYFIVDIFSLFCLQYYGGFFREGVRFDALL